MRTHLQGNLHEIGSEGHPELPQSGEVPNLPDWSYLFHGRGCRFISDVTGELIDVDFGPGRDSGRIDPHFYSNFLNSLKCPEFPEWVLQKPLSLCKYWHQDLDELQRLGFWDGQHVTEQGARLYVVLAPVVEKLYQAQVQDQKTLMTYLCLNLGDYVLADTISKTASLSSKFSEEIKELAHASRTERAKQLSSIVALDTQGDGISLQALAELGPEFSKEEVLDCLFHFPVDGASNTALEILNLWQQDDLDSILTRLIGARLGQVDLLEENNDRKTLEYQLMLAVRFALVRQKKPVESPFRDHLINTLSRNTWRSQGEAAFLLYLLDTRKGIQAFRRAALCENPLVLHDIVAACVVIGNDTMKQFLIETLHNC